MIGLQRERLALARRQRGLSQTALAKRIGVSPVTVNHWETGKRHAMAYTLALAARELGVSMDWLMGLTD